MSRIVKLDEIYFDLDDFSLLSPFKEINLSEQNSEKTVYLLYTKNNESHYLSNKAAERLMVILDAECANTTESYTLKPIQWADCKTCPRLIPVTDNGNGKCWECR